MRTALETVTALGLEPHPSGCGYFLETYRNPTKVPLDGFDGPRHLSTAIYNLMNGTHRSQLHKTKADETVHFYNGNTNLLIHTINEHHTLTTVELGPHDGNFVFQHHIPRDHWFVAETKDKAEESFVLSGYTVSPGFEFADFTNAKRQDLIELFPALEDFITQFTPDD